MNIGLIGSLWNFSQIGIHRRNHRDFIECIHIRNDLKSMQCLLHKMEDRIRKEYDITASYKDA